MKKFDVDGNGEIDFPEFLQLMERNPNVGEIDELLEAFRVFDKDNSGSISASEISAVMVALGDRNVSEADIQLMVKSVDTDGNGSIDFEEFKKMMLDGPPQVLS